MKSATPLLTGILFFALCAGVAFADIAVPDTTTAPTPTATISIRDGSTLIGPLTYTIPDASQTLPITPNEGTTSVILLPADTVLGALESLAAANGFSFADIGYYDFGQPYAGGLYVNCVSIPAATSSPLCAGWQFDVNGSVPQEGTGVVTLNDGDNVILYFGYPRDVTLSTTTVEAGQPFTATAQAYDPSTDTFSPATGVTIGVTQQNPDDPYNPTEIATSTVDQNGQAIFTLDATGTYGVGIQEDYYSPTTALTVVATSSSSSSSSNTNTSGGNGPPVGGGGGGGGGGVSHSQLNIANALAYLESEQHADGSFDSPLYTDWAALALAAGNGGSALQKITAYEASASPALSSATDYERRALALEALGINPYSGAGKNYIAPIVADFDGTQIGDPSEDNDDIFALLALLPAGYTSSDTIIQKEAAFILSKQNPDGSWDESPDLTAAAIQALGPLFDLSGINQALGEAAGYLASSEKADGSWSENIDSTSWVQTAINGIIQAQTPGFTTESPWTSSGGDYPTDFIAESQQQDGAVQPASDPTDTRVWSTSYAIVAASGQSWNSLLKSFPKPASSASGGGSAITATSTNSTATTTAATSTPSIATSTLAALSTSTPPTLTATATSTTASTSTLPVHKKSAKVPAPHPRPQHATTTAATTSQGLGQTAAAATGFNGNALANFFASFWHRLTSIF